MSPAGSVERLDDLEHLGQRAMTGGFLDDHVQLGGREARAVHAASLRDRKAPGGQRQLADLRLQRLEGQPGVEQGAEDHVAAGAGEAVEIGNPRHAPIVASARR